jgi:hypothetical protein
MCGDANCDAIIAVTMLHSMRELTTTNNSQSCYGGTMNLIERPCHHNASIEPPHLMEAVSHSRCQQGLHCCPGGCWQKAACVAWQLMQEPVKVWVWGQRCLDSQTVTINWTAAMAI